MRIAQWRLGLRLGLVFVNVLNGVNGAFVAFDNYSGCKSVSAAVKLNYQWAGEKKIYIGGK